MAFYSPELTLREARSQFFERNKFGDGGYEDRWVKLKAGPIRLYFPNTEARARAAQLHDLHHVLTGYDTTWSGEAQIGGWELASGCRRHYPAWVLNFCAFTVGLLIAPRAVYRGFLRGRGSLNLYSRVLAEELLACTVGKMRQELHIEGSVGSAFWWDKTIFASWVLAAIVTLLIPVAGALGILAVVIRLVE